MTGTRPSERHPWLFPWAVRAHRVRRHLQWLRPGTERARDHGGQNLPVRVKKHASLLLRELPEPRAVRACEHRPEEARGLRSVDSGPELARGLSDASRNPEEEWIRLQHNKVVNLRLASRRTDGLLIRPGETFSFNKVVGSCTRRKGYVEGMRLSNGDAISGVGGGICQLANLVHWMVLHSPLTVVERSEHSFDPFPDKGRVLPWGVGCSIVYNYVDLVVRNDTATTFQLRTWVAQRHLRGELRADRPTAASYRVEARDEEFLRIEGRVYRRNEIWRTVIDKRTGDVVAEELVRRNRALVKYAPPEHLIRETGVATAPRGRAA